MIHLVLVANAALAGVIGLQPAQAYEAPWCAVLEVHDAGGYWDCQYHSFEDCYREAIFWQAIAAFVIRARTTSLDPRSKG
jgi:hypothetical protein